MKRKISTLMVASAALAVGMLLMPLDASAKKPSGDVIVNCDAGESIQAALNKASLSVPLTLTVVGTCEEDVTIRRDDVTINGNNNATVDGTILLSESDRITLLNLTLTGQGNGLRGFGSNVTLHNVIVTENQDVGIQVFSSTAHIHNSLIAGNQGFTAVQAGHVSALEIFDSEVSNNAGTGLYVDLNSMLQMSNNTVVSGNSGIGVQLVLNSSALIWNGASIQGNAVGVEASKNSAVELMDADVSNNETYGIVLYDDSGARVSKRNHNYR